MATPRKTTKKTPAPKAVAKKAAPRKVAPAPQPLSGDRQQGESDAAVQACNDWLCLGKFRSLPRLHQVYEKVTESNRKLPNPVIGTLKNWSSQFGWTARAQLFDEDINEERRIQRLEVYDQGLALDFERVALLKEVAVKLRTEVLENGVFLTKKIVTDEGEYILDERYNSSLIGDLVRLLEDIAKEKGERHKDASTITLLSSLRARLDMSKIPQDQFDQIARGDNWLEVLLRPYLRDD